MAAAPASREAEFIVRLRERDRTAWEELYRGYSDRLYAFAYRLTGNQRDAADLAQDRFARALPRLDQLDPRGLDLSAYLFATAKNLFLISAERLKRARPVEEVPGPGEPPPIEEEPAGRALLRRHQEDVRVANGKLAPRQPLVLALCELEERSYTEIGELCGLNANTVAQLIFRARQKVREELRLFQVDPTSMPDECEEHLPALSAHLDGQLREPERTETLAHLEACRHCRAALENMRETSRRYRGLIPPAGTLLGELRGGSRTHSRRRATGRGRREAGGE